MSVTANAKKEKKLYARNERMTQKTDKTSINVDFKTPPRFKAAFNLSLATIFTSN